MPCDKQRPMSQIEINFLPLPQPLLNMKHSLFCDAMIPYSTAIPMGCTTLLISAVRHVPEKPYFILQFLYSFIFPRIQFERNGSVLVIILLRLRLQTDFFFYLVRLNTRATCLTQLSLLDFIALIIPDDVLRDSSLCSFPPFPLRSISIFF
jgi:hypothetical protein